MTVMIRAMHSPYTKATDNPYTRVTVVATIGIHQGDTPERQTDSPYTRATHNPYTKATDNPYTLRRD